MLLNDAVVCIVSTIIKFCSFIFQKQKKLFLVVDSLDEALYGQSDDEDDKTVKAPSTSGINFQDNIPNAESVMHQNYPIIVKEFICPNTETDKVLIVVSLPGGAQNTKVELHEDGLSVSVKYCWAKTIYNVKDLFKKQLSAGELQEYHPLVLSVKAGLAEARKKIDLAPESVIKIVLPIKVQTAVDSWEKWGVKRDDGTQIVLATFAGFDKDYVKKASDEAVKFD